MRSYWIGGIDNGMGRPVRHRKPPHRRPRRGRRRRKATSGQASKEDRAPRKSLTTRLLLYTCQSAPPRLPTMAPPSVCNRYVQLTGQRRPTRILTSGPRRRKWLHCGAHPAGIARPRVRRTATSGFPRAAHPPRLTRRAQLPCGLHRAVRTKRRPGRGSLPRRGREAVVRGRRGHDPGRCL